LGVRRRLTDSSPGPLYSAVVDKGRWRVGLACWWGLHGAFPRNTECPAGEEGSQRGGEGRVQAERPTCRSPQGQSDGPEGERCLDWSRSP